MFILLVFRYNLTMLPHNYMDSYLFYTLEHSEYMFNLYHCMPKSYRSLYTHVYPRARFVYINLQCGKIVATCMRAVGGCYPSIHDLITCFNALHTIVS
jgi:hypothetical protein